MIEELADLLAATLSPLTPTAITLLGGLVQTLETDKPLTANPWLPPKPEGTLKLPIARNLTPNLMARSGMEAIDFTPHQKHKAIVYIEDMGAARQTDDNGNKFAVSLRIVGWYNKSLPETMNLPRRVSILIGEIQGSGSFQHIAIAKNGRQIHPGSAALFSRYTYNQLTSQYLFPPYGCFAVDVQLTFTLNKSC